MELPGRWHPTLLKALYASGILLVFATAYVAGKNARHQDHLLLYTTFTVDAIIAAVTLYCGNESDRRARRTRKATSGPCANHECDRQVFFSVGAQDWLHYGNYSATCTKKLATTAAPAQLHHLVA
jgi:RES domain-containing protein